MRITIIGAGPVGSYLAYKLASAGHEARVYEEHEKTGEPVQCTGTVSSEIAKIIRLDSRFVINRLDKANLYSKRKAAEIDTADIVIDRKKLDIILCNKAKKAGAKIIKGHKFLGMKKDKAVLADRKNKLVKTEQDVLIGTDGPLSDVARSNMIFGKRELYIGIQARVKGKFEKSAYKVYLGSIAPGFFAWAVPESSEIARVGIAGKKRVADNFMRLLKIIKAEKIINKQAGLMPVYDPKIQFRKGNIYLAGDAAAQTNATTGRGLVQGLKAAGILADCLDKGKDYAEELKELRKELWMQKKIRKIMNNLSDKDYDSLVEMAGKEKIKNLLNRDNAFRLIARILINKPGFIRYAARAV